MTPPHPAAGVKSFLSCPARRVFVWCQTAYREWRCGSLVGLHAEWVALPYSYISEGLPQFCEADRPGVVIHQYMAFKPAADAAPSGHFIQVLQWVAGELGESPVLVS